MWLLRNAKTIYLCRLRLVRACLDYKAMEDEDVSDSCHGAPRRVHFITPARSERKGRERERARECELLAFYFSGRHSEQVLIDGFASGFGSRFFHRWKKKANFHDSFGTLIIRGFAKRTPNFPQNLRQLSRLYRRKVYIPSGILLGERQFPARDQYVCEFMAPCVREPRISPSWFHVEFSIIPVKKNKSEDNLA